MPVLDLLFALWCCLLGGVIALAIPKQADRWSRAGGILLSGTLLAAAVRVLAIHWVVSWR